MNAEIKLAANIDALMHEMGRRARAAAQVLALATPATKAQALHGAARAIRAHQADILAANALDLADARANGTGAAFIDRLTLDPARVAAIADSVAAIAELPDPVGAVTAEWTQPSGLRIQRVRTPLGVIGVIFESRPNVTADAGALCLKAGNAVILRAGSDSLRSSLAIHAAMVEGLVKAGLPAAAVQLVPSKDRSAVGAMLAGLDGSIDVIVPRGGKSLVARVQAEARVPIFAHLDGNNHVYVHEKADIPMARAILVNAKMRRTGVCGAAETLLIDRSIAGAVLKPLIDALVEAGCAVRGDAATVAIDPRASLATEADWGTEYLDAIIAVKVVDGLEAAIAHIGHYGSHHTDAIVTSDESAAARFLSEIDSAIVLHNASTQFADGGEFGFGAEIGIATGRMHARGPVGVEQLTSFKYKVFGKGTVRS